MHLPPSFHPFIPPSTFEPGIFLPASEFKSVRREAVDALLQVWDVRCSYYCNEKGSSNRFIFCSAATVEAAAFNILWPTSWP